MPLLKLLLDICLYRKGPQDLPASGFLLRLTLAAYWVVGTLLQAPDGGGWLPAMLQTAAELVMSLAVVAVLLYTVGRPQRFLQTATAWLGTDALVSLLGIPPLQLIADIGAGPIAGLLWLLLVGWHIAVMAHIMHHALSQSLPVGFVVAVLYTIASFQVLAFLFPSV
jgi:hypothetical protein